MEDDRHLREKIRIFKKVASLHLKNDYKDILEKEGRQKIVRLCYLNCFQLVKKQRKWRREKDNSKYLVSLIFN